MLTLLAEASPSAHDLKTFFEVVVYLAVGIAAIAVAYSHLTGKSGERVITPQPLEVKASEEFATHFEFQELKADVEQIRAQVKEGFDKLADERRTSVGNLHGKIDETNSKVDEMRGEVRLINQQLAMLLSRQLNK